MLNPCGYPECGVRSTMGTVEVLSVVYDTPQADYADLFVDDFLQHARIEDSTGQESVIRRYIRAAIDVAENYTNRDVYPRTRTYRASDGTYFEWRRGIYSALVVTDANSVDVSGDLTYVVSGGEKGTGFVFDLEGTASPIGVEVSSGYPDPELMPGDLYVAILTFAAMLYEMRETANYTAMVQHAEVLPMYLLDAWRIPGFA